MNAYAMPDLSGEVPQVAESGPAPQPEPGPASGSTQQPEPARQPDTPAGAGDAPTLDAEEEDDTVLGAEDLAESISARRRMRQAGLESLGGTWFSGATRFDGPASLGGHAAARDVNIYYATTERTIPETGPIGRERLRRVRVMHVASPSCTAAERVLREERLVVLRGADGSGKRTTALFMLSKLAGDDVHAISAELVLGSPDGFGLRERIGYLAECLAPAELPYTRLAALSAELRQLGAYLLITVPADAAADVNTAGHFVVDHEPPDCREVLRRHLHLDADHAHEADRLLQNDPGLACATSPGAAADLATKLLAIVRDGRPIGDLGPALISMRRQRARHLLRTDRPKEPRERVELLCRRAALVSVAVFIGLPYADAVAAAEALAIKFIAIEFPKLKGREIFIPRREYLLAEPDIMIEELRRPARWGRAVTQQLRFRDPEFHAAVLEEVWEHYDTARSPLLLWLRELAVSSRDEAIRVRAAQVVGRLAVRDFGHVCHQVFIEWSDSVNSKAREAAATALEAVAVSMSPLVWNLLAEWCKDGNQNRQRTAVLALGTGISEHDPVETLARLRQLALRSTGRPAQTMGEAVRHSVTELISGAHQATVVRALRAWTDDADLRLRAVARRCIPPLAHVVDDFGRPLLLLASSGRPALRADIVALVTAALEEPDTRQETWTALEKLATGAAHDPALTDALGTLLTDLRLASSTAASQLTFYLRLWAYRHSELTSAFPARIREGDHARQ
jgi:hypothetical protein